MAKRRDEGIDNPKLQEEIRANTDRWGFLGLGVFSED
jgi:hypothetical protein